MKSKSFWTVIAFAGGAMLFIAMLYTLQIITASPVRRCYNWSNAVDKARGIVTEQMCWTEYVGLVSMDTIYILAFIGVAFLCVGTPLSITSPKP